MELGDDPEDRTDENARLFAKSGAKLGAAAGGRVGPVTTGLASGLGGAVGYITGAAVDGVQTSLERGPAATDGGQPVGGEEAALGTEIPVSEES